MSPRLLHSAPGRPAGDTEIKPPAPPGSLSFLSQSLVLIPALDEAQIIGQTVRDWQALGVGCIRVVDNGSRDDTAGEAKRAGAEVLTELRRGYGAACWTGLQVFPPGIKYVLFSSADGSDRFLPSELHAWEQACHEGYDLVLGNRCLYPGALASLKPWQRLGSLVSSVIMRLGWQVRFDDMGSRRLIAVDAFRRLGLRDRGFGWNVEMQIRATEEGLRLIELPVPYFPRRAGRSKISGNWLGSLKASWGILSTLLLLWITKASRRP